MTRYLSAVGLAGALSCALTGISSALAPAPPPPQGALQTDPVLNWSGLYYADFGSGQGYHEAVGELVVGDFTGNGRQDCVTILDGVRAALTQDVAERHGRHVLKVHDPDPAEVPVNALALHPGGGGVAGHDALLTAGPDGIHHWRWDESAKAMLSTVVTAPGIGYSDVAIAHGTAGGIRVAYGLRSGQRTVDILLFLGGSGDFFMQGSSFARYERIHAIECVDFAGDSVAECVLVDDSAIAVYDHQGARIQDLPHGQSPLQDDLLAPLLDANRPEQQLAWLHHASTGTELWTMSGATLLGPTPVAAAHGLALAAGDQTGDGLADIAIVAADQGRLHLFDAMSAGTGSTRYDDHPSRYRVVTTVPLVFPAIMLAEAGGVAVSDLDGDGDVDVLQSQSNSSWSYLLAHRADVTDSADAAPDLLGVTLAELIDPGLEPGFQAFSMAVELAEPSSGSGTDALHVRVWHRGSVDHATVEEAPVVDQRIALPNWPHTVDEELTLPIVDDAIWYVEAFLVDTATGASGPVATFVVSFDTYDEMVVDAAPGHRLWGGSSIMAFGKAVSGTAGGTRVQRIPPPPPPPPPAPSGS